MGIIRIDVGLLSEFYQHPEIAWKYHGSGGRITRTYPGLKLDIIYLIIEQDNGKNIKLGNEGGEHLLEHGRIFK